MSLSEKKVGVTGSSGFLGSNFLKKLSKVGAKIFMIGRRADPLFSHAERQLTFDFYKAPSLEVKEALQELDYLVHIGAYVPKSSKKEGYDDPLLSVEANIKGILKMLPFLKNVQRIIYASTLEVYGVPKYIPIDENHPTNPTTYYGASKLSCEKYLQVFSKRNNVPITVLRFTTVFGPGEHYQRAIPNFIQAVISKKPIKIFDTGQDLRDYIYVDDAASAIIHALVAQKAGIYNICSGIGRSMIEIAHTINKLCGVEKPKIQFLKVNKPHLNIILNGGQAAKDLLFIPKANFESGLLKEINWFERKSRQNTE